MSAAIANLVEANLEGQRRAIRFIDSLSWTIQHPDALGQAIVDLDPLPDVRRGFAREIQKRLARGAS